MSDAVFSAQIPVWTTTPEHFLEHAAGLANIALNAPHHNTSCSSDVWFSVFLMVIICAMRRGVQNHKKMSSVAKLLKASPNINDSMEIYPVYVPGVGTCFPEVGDAGGVAKLIGPRSRWISL